MAQPGRRQTLRRIAREPAARCPVAIMVVLQAVAVVQKLREMAMVQTGDALQIPVF
jgi:hypothetical protein